MFLIFRNADELSPGLRILLEEGEVAHARARRLGPGSTVYAGDGQFRRWKGELTWEGKKSAYVTLGASCIENREPERLVVCAIPKSGRRDWMIEKATELGMTELIPCQFHRSVREKISHPRFDRIVREASAQCEAWKLPVLSEPADSQKLPDLLAHRMQQGYHILILDIVEEDGPVRPGQSLLRHSPGPTLWTPPSGPAESPGAVSDMDANGAVLIVGPEGGFSPGEREVLQELCNKHPDRGAFLQMGSRVLRTETAVLAGLTYLSISRVSN